MSPFVSPTAPPPATSPSWAATFTLKEALRLGIVTKDQFAACDLIARTVVEDHMRAGTPRREWEPNLTHIQQVVAPYLADAVDVRDRRIATDIDPVLDQIREAMENARASIDTAAGYPAQVELVENGGTIPGPVAADTTRDLQRRVDAETAAGATHHARTSRFWRLVAPWIPVGEAIAAGAFLAWNLDVPLTAPWQDPLGALLVLVMVSVILGLQPRLITAAATAHNQARENRYNGNRRHAEDGYLTRNRHLIAACAVAVVITGGLTYRSLAVLADHTPAAVALMVGFSLAAGIGLPALAYVLIAFDGSRLSRQAETAAADQDQDAAEYDTYRADAAGHLALVDELATTLATHTIPATLEAAQQALAPARDCYDFIRAQIGGLPDPPNPGSTTIVTISDTNGRPATITTGVPGARDLDLTPIQTRIHAAQHHRQAAQDLAQQLRQLQNHPWTRRGD